MKTDHYSAPETVQKVLELFPADGRHVAIARPELAEAMGVGATTIQRCLTQLLEEGCLTIVRRGTGPGYPTIYAATGRPAPVNPYAYLAPSQFGREEPA